MSVGCIIIIIPFRGQTRRMWHQFIQCDKRDVAESSAHCQAVSYVLVGLGPCNMKRWARGWHITIEGRKDFWRHGSKLVTQTSILKTSQDSRPPTVATMFKPWNFDPLNSRIRKEQEISLVSSWHAGHFKPLHSSQAEHPHRTQWHDSTHHSAAAKTAAVHHLRCFTSKQSNSPSLSKNDIANPIIAHKRWFCNFGVTAKKEDTR